jgi:hypothetical protein
MSDYLGGELQGNHRLDIPSKYQHYFKFCVVRNPYSRVVSHWYSGSQRGVATEKYRFEEVIGDTSFESYLEYLLNKESYSDRLNWPFEVRQVDYMINTYDKILSFERLDSEFRKLPFFKRKTQLLQINPTVTEWEKNPVVRDHWTSYITEASLKMINNYYAEDFDNFRYPMYKTVDELLQKELPR